MSEQDGSSWPPGGQAPSPYAPQPPAPSPYQAQPQAAPSPNRPQARPAPSPYQAPPQAPPQARPAPAPSPYQPQPQPHPQPQPQPRPAPSPYGAPPAPSPYGAPAAPSPYGRQEPPEPHDQPDLRVQPELRGQHDRYDRHAPRPPHEPDGRGEAAEPARRRRDARAPGRSRSLPRGLRAPQLPQLPQLPHMPHVPRGVLVGGAVVAAVAAARAPSLLGGDDDGTELSATSGDATKGTSLDSGSSAGGQAPRARGGSAIPLPKGLDVDHLLKRVTYGPTEALRAQVRSQGAAAWLAAQLDPAGLPDPGGDAVSAMFPQLALTPAEAEKNVTDRWGFQRDLAAAHLGRALWSSRQLFEVMVAFWSDHFTIPCPGDRAQLTRHRFDAEVIRRGALGRFEDMLQASAVHPAALDHFDTGVSTGDNPNENYARALLEHHTVGPAFTVTERDVQQAALMFTGFQVKDHAPRFVPSLHHTGQIEVLNFTHRNDSQDGGRDAAAALLRHLARHPATAAHLARKLAVRFVADDPPAPLVGRLAEAYLAGDTDIVPVLTTLLSSPEFAASGGRKLRTPTERLTATVRVLGIEPGKDPRPLIQLHWLLRTAGHAPLGCPRPEGYPDVASAWQSPAAALAHFNSAAQLAHGWWPQGLTNPGPGKLLRTQPTTRTAAIEAVGTRLLGRPPTAAERTASAKLLAATKLPAKFAAGSWEQKETLGLVATLLLNSPAHLMR